MSVFYIYRHFRLDTNECFYVGKGSDNRAYWKYKRNDYWNNIVNKHGYRVELIEKDLSEEVAFTLEMILIEEHGRRDLGTGSLVNMTDGGDGVSGHKHSDETKVKMSEAQSGDKHHMFGKIPSDKTKALISAAQTGNKHYNFGKTLSDKTITMISAARKKQVINCREQIFDSAIKAAEVFGLKSSSGITTNLKGQSKSAGKYPDGTKVKWSYYVK